LLPVIVFVTLFGIAAAMLPAERRAPSLRSRRPPARRSFESCTGAAGGAHRHLALVAPSVVQYGWEVVRAMLWFIAAVIIGVIVFIAAVYLPSVALIAHVAPRRFCAPRSVHDGGILGDDVDRGTANLIDAADKDLQIPRPVSSFVLPLGASINRAGSALFRRSPSCSSRACTAFRSASNTCCRRESRCSRVAHRRRCPSGGVISLFPAFQATGLPVAGLSILLGLDASPTCSAR